jgi:hypothetical protein
MTPEEEFKIYLLYKEGAKNEEIIEKTVRADGSKWSNSKITKLRTKFNKGHIPSLSADKAERAMDSIMGIGLGADLKDFDAEKSMSRSFKMATRMLEQALKDAEAGYEIEDEMRRRIPIKTIMECIEKAGRYWTTYQKTRKESGSGGKAVQIDYQEMAKIYMGAKAENIPYDAKSHMKAVLEEVTKQNDDLEEETFE